MELFPYNYTTWLYSTTFIMMHGCHKAIAMYIYRHSTMKLAALFDLPYETYTHQDSFTSCTIKGSAGVDCELHLNLPQTAAPIITGLFGMRQTACEYSHASSQKATIIIRNYVTTMEYWRRQVWCDWAHTMWQKRAFKQQSALCIAEIYSS